jgi:ParB-like chromosome segregation protein Spo0J
MAETIAAAANEAEQPAPDISPSGGDIPAPGATDGDVVVSSNVIDGLFDEKRAAVIEAEKRAAEQDKIEREAAGEQAPEKKEGRKGRPPKEKPEKAAGAEKPEKPKKAERGGRPPKGPKEEAAPVLEPPAPEPPRDATRPGATEQIVYIDHADLFPFKNHPFQVRDDDAMKSLVASVKERGVDQPALVRPREGGGYELVAGHRRQKASELAGLKNVPCVVRDMTDDEAVLAMTESNFNQRAEILPSERAQALKMQLEAIKHQGTRFDGIASGDVGKRSNEIVAGKNKMAVKQVQRYIALNNLAPDLMKLVDEKKIPFTPAVEMSYIRPKNQKYIAVAIDAQQSAPSLAQAQRMRELDQKGILNGDVIDGIMLEEKKEETRVILNSQELGKYFGPDKSPREMKDTILKLLDEYKEKQPPELGKSVKKQEQAI